ncbi:MAG TPA: hypothetical protein VIU12_18710 [Chryseolinea sp.]
MTFDIISIIIAAAIFFALAIPIWLFVRHAKKDAQDIIEQIRKENLATKENAADNEIKQRRVRVPHVSTRRRSYRT